MKEITFELTDFCPYECKFCSAMAGPHGKTDLDIDVITEHLQGKEFDVINLSGGEPLSHPQLWEIICLCRAYLTELGELWIYTNVIEGLRYNLHVRDRVKIHANATVDPDTDAVHVLARQKHGRESKRPKVTQSGKECKSCDHVVIRPNGNVEKPCKKS